MLSISKNTNFEYRNSYHIKTESKREQDEIKLKELGLYPKNLELTYIAGTEFYDNLDLYVDYINERDIENLDVLRGTGEKPISNSEWEYLTGCNKNLHADFIIKMGIGLYISNFRIINRTYKNIYKLALQINIGSPYFVYIKPKNAEEKLYYEKCLALNIKFSKNIYRFPVNIGVICEYAHFRKK